MSFQITGLCPFVAVSRHPRDYVNGNESFTYTWRFVKTITASKLFSYRNNLATTFLDPSPDCSSSNSRRPYVKYPERHWIPASHGRPKLRKKRRNCLSCLNEKIKINKFIYLMLTLNVGVLLDES